MGKFKWFYEINQEIINNDKEFTIIERKKLKNRQYYKIKCNKCGFDSNKEYIKLKNNPKRIILNEYWIEKDGLEKMNSCPCCGKNVQVICFGINDLATTNPQLVKFFKGGKQEAKLYHATSQERVNLFCPDCKTDITNIMIRQFTKKKNYCPNCGGGGYYPNRLMFNILKELHQIFESEYSPTWIAPKRYDFYLPKFNIIIEMDGSLGHGNKIHTKSKITLNESISIDKYKDEQANLHGISVIRIDCKKSDFNYIKNNIIKSDLCNYFNFNNLNWDIIRIKALTPIMLTVCNMYKNGMINTYNIANEVGMKPSSIRNYLHEGTALGLCNYDNNKLRKQNCHENSGSFKSKKIVLLNTLEVFNTQTEAQEKYKVENISDCCRGKRSYAGIHSITYEPLVWVYYEDYLIMSKEDIKNKFDIKISKGRNVPIICIQTKEIFKSLKDAAERYSLKTPQMINKCCKNNKLYYGELDDGTKLQWMYYTDFKRSFG